MKGHERVVCPATGRSTGWVDHPFHPPALIKRPYTVATRHDKKQNACA